MALRNLFHR